MAINIRNGNFRVDVDSHGLIARYARVRHFFDANGDVPSYSVQSAAELSRYNDTLVADRTAFSNLSLADRDNDWLDSEVRVLGTNNNNILMFNPDGLSSYFNIRNVFKIYLNELLDQDPFERRKVFENILQAMDDDSEIVPRLSFRISDSIKNQNESWQPFHDALNSRLDSDSDVATRLSQIIVDAVEKNYIQSRQVAEILLQTLGNDDDSGDSDRNQFFNDVFYKYLNDADGDRNSNARWETLWDSLNSGYFSDSDSDGRPRRAVFLEELTSSLVSDSEIHLSVARDVAALFGHNHVVVSDFFSNVNSYLGIDSDSASYGNPLFGQVDNEITHMVDRVVDSEIADGILVRGFQNLSERDGLNSSGPMSIGAILSAVASANFETVTVHRNVFYPGDVDIGFNDIDGSVENNGLKSLAGVDRRLNRDSEFMDFAFPNPDVFREPTNLSNIKVYVNGIRQITVGENTQNTSPAGALNTNRGLVLEDGTDIVRPLVYTDDSEYRGDLRSSAASPAFTMKFVEKRYQLAFSDSESRYQAVYDDSDATDSDGNAVQYITYNTLRVYFAAIDTTTGGQHLDSDDYMWDSDTPSVVASDPNAFFLRTGDVVTVEYLTSRIES